MLFRIPFRVLSPTRNNPLRSNPSSLRHYRISNWPETVEMAMSQSVSKRPTCVTCSRPARLCLCTRIRTPDIDNKVSVTILQHSLEKKHPLNSARIVKLGLRNVAVHIVSDVNFDARFFIWLLEPNSKLGLSINGRESSDFDKVLEVKGIQKRKLEDVGGLCVGRENMGVGDLEFIGYSKCPKGEKSDVREIRGSELMVSCGLVSGMENESRNSGIERPSVPLHEAILLDDRSDLKQIPQGNEGPVIDAKIGKYGVINDLHNIWICHNNSTKGPSFDRILTSRVADDALARGFIVKKLQKRQLNRSVDLEEYEEFELEIPSGSILLFPSDKAVGVDDLRAMNFEVKKLIVLDGTWAKARRMYEENPWLKLLPHLKLDLDKRSLYSEVRHEPKAGYLSTIESIIYAFKALGENPEGLDSLLDVFESMVGDQRRCKDERLSKAS